MPEHLHEIGRLDTSLPFEELRRRGHINARAREADATPDFSRRIRVGVPGVARNEDGGSSRPLPVSNRAGGQSLRTPTSRVRQIPHRRPGHERLDIPNESIGDVAPRGGWRFGFENLGRRRLLARGVLRVRETRITLASRSLASACCPCDPVILPATQRIPASVTRPSATQVESQEIRNGGR